MPSPKWTLLLALALAACGCAHADRPRSLASLGVVFSYEGESGLICGFGLARAGLGENPRFAARRDAEEKLLWNEAAVAAIVLSARRTQQMAVNRIHWEPAKRSRLLCNKAEKRCVFSVRPADVQDAASVPELLEDLPVGVTKESLKIP